MKVEVLKELLDFLAQLHSKLTDGKGEYLDSKSIKVLENNLKKYIWKLRLECPLKFYGNDFKLIIYKEINHFQTMEIDKIEIKGVISILPADHSSNGPKKFLESKVYTLKLKTTILDGKEVLDIIKEDLQSRKNTEIDAIAKSFLERFTP